MILKAKKYRHKYNFKTGDKKYNDFLHIVHKITTYFKATISFMKYFKHWVWK